MLRSVLREAFFLGKGGVRRGGWLIEVGIMNILLGGSSEEYKKRQRVVIMKL